MEYHLYPPFFEITPEPSFSDAWEAFCCLLLNLRNGTTEIRRRTPPDSGVDLTWSSTKFAYQCKAVESGKAGDFPLSKAIDSVETALQHRASIGWDKYGICTNVDVTGAQEEKIRKVYADVEL